MGSALRLEYLQSLTGVFYAAREDALYVRKLVNGSHGKRVSSYERGDAPPPSQRSLDSLGALTAFAENTTVCRHIVSVHIISRYISR